MHKRSGARCKPHDAGWPGCKLVVLEVPFKQHILIYSGEQESKEDQTTHVKFVIDDGTGKIECKQVRLNSAQVFFI